MQRAADYAENGFGPEIGQVWHPYEMMGEMRMQMSQPALALAALSKAIKMYPNRFNSIAAAAAAAAALESSASPSSSSSALSAASASASSLASSSSSAAAALSPSAASLYAQLLNLASSAPALRAATANVPGESVLQFVYTQTSTAKLRWHIDFCPGIDVQLAGCAASPAPPRPAGPRC